MQTFEFELIFQGKRICLRHIKFGMWTAIGNLLWPCPANFVPKVSSLRPSLGYTHFTITSKAEMLTVLLSNFFYLYIIFGRVKSLLQI